jgi:hypothetical protein
MSDPGNASQTPSQSPETTSGFWPSRPHTWLFAGSLVAGMFWVFCIPLINFQSRRQPSRCHSNLRLISLALANYEFVNKSLPPAFVADADGRPMHSWRVLILPYLDQQDLYDEYRFDEPWDGPHNSRLANRCPEVFRCPEDMKRYGHPNAWNTSYVAVVGTEAVWQGQEPAKYRDISDGTPNTIILVESADCGIPWMEPRDLVLEEMPFTINSPSGKGISSAHKDGAFVALAEGRIAFLNASLKGETVRALLTRDGGETVSESY